jgi:GAF domain-containing protein
MNREQDLERLWALILTEARRLSGADAGSLFLRREETLEFVVAQNQTLAARGGADVLTSLLGRGALAISEQSIAGYVALTGTPVHLADVRRISSRLPFRHNSDFDDRNGYRTQSLLAVPLKHPGGRVLGVLQLINCTDPAGRTIPFPADRLTLIEAMASLAAVALRNCDSRSDLRENPAQL